MARLGRSWRVLVLGAVIGVLGGLLLATSRPPEFTSNLKLYVSAQTANSATSAYQGTLLSQDRVKSYTELVNSRRILKAVATRLSIAEAPEALATRISATSNLDSVVIDVTVTDTNAARAAAIANVVGQEFVAMTSALEQPAQPEVAPAVAVRVVQPATLPASPSSPSAVEQLVTGGFIGLAIAVAWILLSARLSTRLRSEEELKSLSKVPNLGSIPQFRSSDQPKLVISTEPQSAVSESFRLVRTNLQFVAPPHQKGQAICISSPLPSEGKTTSVANLSLVLADTGYRVLVVEADLRRPALSKAFGLDNAVGLTNVLAGQITVDEALQKAAGRVDLLASGWLPPDPAEILGSKQFAELIRELGESYSFVLIDTPPLIPVADTAALAPSTDGLLLICRQGRTTSTQLRQTVEQIEAVSARIIGTLLTMTDSRSTKTYGYYSTPSSTEDGQGADTTDQLHRSDLAQSAIAPRRPSPHRRSST